MKQHVIALDQGTTSSRAIVFDERGKIVSVSQQPFNQIYPKPGWVEHDPMAILYTQMGALTEAFRSSGLSVKDIAALGITNQRETTIVWETDVPYTTPSSGSAAAPRRCARSLPPRAGKR